MKASRMRNSVAALLFSSLALAVASTPAHAAGTLQVSPSSVAFGNGPVGATSAAKTVTLTNTGSASVSLSSITLTGSQAHDFTLTSTCGKSLAVSANCKLSIAFKPVSTGSKASTVSITDDASGSPQSVALTGSGVAASGTPSLKLSATTLAFGSEAVGGTSAAKTVTLTNSGTASLTLSSIALTGSQAHDFPLSNPCPSSLAAGASCTLSVTFKPVSTGAKSSSISISDNASGSPQSVTLSGTGTTSAGAPAVKLSASSLAFGNEAVGSTSAAKTVTLTNSGTASLTLSSIALTGSQAHDFPLSNPCPSSLAAGASCTLSVTFKPVSTGAKSSSISISDNASGSPQTVSLSGTGTTAATAPAVTLSATSLAFGNEAVGGTSASKTVTLSNSGNATLNLTSVALSGSQSDDFSLTNGCGSSLKAGASCMLTAAFTPVASGAKTATVKITDNAAGSPQSVALSGTGVALTPTPTFSPAPGSYSSAQTVSISDTASGAVIYYTTDGSTPTTSSTKYTAAIKVSSTETLSAIAVANSSPASAVASGVYSIGASGTAQLWTAFMAAPVSGTTGGQSGIFVLPSNQLTTANPVFVTHRTSIATLGFLDQVSNPYSGKAAIVSGALWYSADGSDGKTHLYGITLSSSGVPTEKQISNLSLATAEDVCTLGSGQTDYTDSTTMWMLLDIPGSKGCGQAGDKVVLVHYTDSAGTTPATVSLSATATDGDYVEDIVGPDYKSQGILVLNTSTSVLSYYKNNGFTAPTTVLTDVTSFESFAGYTTHHYWTVEDGAQLEHIYAIEAPGSAKKIYDAKSSNIYDSTQDSNNFYFLDGNVLYKEPIAGGTPAKLYTADSTTLPQLVGTDGTSVVMSATVSPASDPTESQFSVFSVPTGSASAAAKTIFGPFTSNEPFASYYASMPEAYFASDSNLDLVYITRTTTMIDDSGSVTFAYATEIMSAQGTVKQALTTNSNIVGEGIEQPVFEVQGITATDGSEGGGIIYAFSPSTLAKTALSSGGKTYHVPSGHFAEGLAFADGQTQGIMYLPNATTEDPTLTGVYDLAAATIKVLSISNTQISPIF